jgi:hypothetical protein
MTGQGQAASMNRTSAAVIMISTHAEADYADLLTESPVLGFLPKGQLSGVAIRRILGRN